MNTDASDNQLYHGFKKLTGSIGLVENQTLIQYDCLRNPNIKEKKKKKLKTGAVKQVLVIEEEKTSKKKKKKI